MKFSKILLAALLGSSVIATANAAPEAKTSAPAQKEDVALKNFNNSVAIRVSKFDNAELQGKKVLAFTHLVQNKGKSSTIKSVKWVTVLVQENGNAIQIPVNAENLNLKPQKGVEVTTALPVESIDPKVYEVLTNPQNRFRPVIAAQELNYTNGKRIVVK